MSQRLTVIVDDDIPAMLLELAGSSRKQGDYISQLVRAAHLSREALPAVQVETLSVEALRHMVMGMIGRLQAMEGRLLQVEATLGQRPQPGPAVE
jgi:hypothetical protein